MKRLVLFLFLAAAHLTAGSFNLYSDSTGIDVGKYRYIKFRVTPDQAEDARVTGEFFTDPADTQLEFVLLTELNYRTGWENRGEIDTLAFFRGGSGTLDIPVPDFGDYVLIVSNRGNYSPVTFYGSLQVAFSGTGITYDALPTGMTVLVSLLAGALVIAAIILTLKKLG